MSCLRRRREDRGNRVGPNQRFRLGDRIGEGAFGEVYEGFDLHNDNKRVAIKAHNMIMQTGTQMWEREVAALERMQGVEGFPTLIWHGAEAPSFHLTVMELLGPSLEDLKSYVNNSECTPDLTLSTMARVGSQLVDRLACMHSHGILHRDIKPENMAMGYGENSRTVYLLDFGLSKSWQDSALRHIKNNSHISSTLPSNRRVVGTLRFSSANLHYGHRCSRRDDLISLGYSLIYLKKGWLPWMGGQFASRHAKLDFVSEKKNMMPLPELCKDMPAPFLLYMKVVTRYSFDEMPDYAGLQGLLDMIRVQYCVPVPWDWELTCSQVRRALVRQRHWQYRDACQERLHRLWVKESDKAAAAAESACHTPDTQRPLSSSSLPVPLSTSSRPQSAFESRQVRELGSGETSSERVRQDGSGGKATPSYSTLV